MACAGLTVWTAIGFAVCLVAPGLAAAQSYEKPETPLYRAPATTKSENDMFDTYVDPTLPVGKPAGSGASAAIPDGGVGAFYDPPAKSGDSLSESAESRLLGPGRQRSGLGVRLRHHAQLWRIPGPGDRQQ